MTAVFDKPLGRSSAVVKRALVVLAAGLAMAPALALAATHVSGNPQAVRIEAQNSSVEQILAALKHEFNVQYTSSANLNQEISGTYRGSLQQVLNRVLDGYNFITKATDGRIEISVLGTRNGTGTAVVAAPPPVSKTAAVAAQAAPLKPESPAPSAKMGEQQQGALLAPTPSPAGHMPEIKLAEEGSAPVPTPPHSSMAAPAPGDASPWPQMQPPKGTAPTVSAGSSLDAPQPAQGLQPQPAQGLQPQPAQGLPPQPPSGPTKPAGTAN